LPSWKAWVERPAGLIKRGKKHKRFKNLGRECFIGVVDFKHSDYGLSADVKPI